MPPEAAVQRTAPLDVILPLLTNTPAHARLFNPFNPFHLDFGRRAGHSVSTNRHHSLVGLGSRGGAHRGRTDGNDDV